MKFLFDDPSFSFETLRAAGFANDDCADLGEIITTARAIPDGDEDAWLRAWQATAERVQALGEASRAAGHRVNAREALLRASNYYRTAEFFRREHPADDPVVADLSRRARATFGAAAELFDTPVEQVEIPYEGTTLPGYLFLADHTGEPRPTLVYVNGFDSTAEEAWFVVGASGVRRGYHVLAVDGPGQGAALREQGLTFRPDWEAVITPVVDHAPHPTRDRPRGDLAVRLQHGRLPGRAGGRVRAPRVRDRAGRRRPRLPLRLRPGHAAVPDAVDRRR